MKTAQAGQQEDATLGDGLPCLGRPVHFTGRQDAIEKAVDAWLDRNRNARITQIDLGLTGDGGKDTLGYVVALWAKPQEEPSSERLLRIFESTDSMSWPSREEYKCQSLDERLETYLDKLSGYQVVQSATACAGEYGLNKSFTVAEAILVEKR